MTSSDDTANAMSRLENAIAKFGYSSVDLIESLLADALRQRDPSYIGRLLRLMDDGAEYDELVFSIIHGAESFEDDVYVDTLLEEFPFLAEKCPRWTSIVLMRVINNESTKALIVKKLVDAGEDTKSAAIWISERINERSPRFLEKTIPVIAAAKQIRF